MYIPTIRELPYMTDFLKIAKSIVVHFAHICAYGVETVNGFSVTCFRTFFADPLPSFNWWVVSVGGEELKWHQLAHHQLMS